VSPHLCCVAAEQLAVELPLYFLIPVNTVHQLFANVEKDWYVVQIIGIIADIQHGDFEVIFSGGTALSKAHKLLQRVLSAAVH